MSRDFIKRLVRRTGFEVRRLDPQASLGFFLAVLLEEYRISCVIDVGASAGQFARHLRGEGYRGPLLSFEPVPESFAALERAARGDRNWQVFNVALGSTEGASTINLSDGGPGLSSFLRPAAAAIESWRFVGTTTGVVKVPLRRLDALLPELGVDERKLERIFLKVDTQGWDLEVIKGAEGMLDKILVLQTELSFKPIYENQPPYRDVLDHLEPLGFEVAGLYPVVRDFNWSFIEADCVLCRKGAQPTRG